MNLKQRIESINLKISDALRRAGRNPDDLTLVAVSKNQPLGLVQEFCAEWQSQGREVVLGENYLQELLSKKAYIPAHVKIHFIGGIQRNKVKSIVSNCDLIESVSSIKILESINRQALSWGKVQSVFLQVNISADPAKQGFMAQMLDQALFEQVTSMKGVRVEGLMTITQEYETAEEARGDFCKLRELAERIQKEFGINPLFLSMGMSNDFEVAIEEGATHIRIGSALFGPRTYKPCVSERMA
jgi:pyridoxal phosphate enzyme (YggS family)